jgi:hypothetical protein
MLDAKYLEAHRALEKKIAEVEADARKLLASGAKIDRVVKLAREGKEIIAARCVGVAAHLDSITKPKPAGQKK